MTRLLPVVFNRCHDCNWRRPKLRHGWKSLFLYFLSVVGYAATIALIAGLVIRILMVVLGYFGVPLPWAE
jgi:hypothetical protein